MRALLDHAWDNLRRDSKEAHKSKCTFPNEIAEMVRAHTGEAAYRRGNLFEKRPALAEVKAHQVVS